ncbi:MAG TPA: diacylglycerol kinase family protein [Candidatus Krumholzibacteria bacterium]|nr:diacylglycerol kinase family protein [Candidatus Krumholzibacteria bacterium]
MTGNADTLVLVNPAAGRGRRKARLRDYLKRLEKHIGPFEPAVTARAGDENTILDTALKRGVERIIALGGDGTWSATANRVLANGRGPDVSVGFLPVGTGNDFGKSIGVRHENIDAVMRAIAERRTRTVDAGKVNDRYFLNVVGMGFDIAVIDDAAATPLLRGDMLYKFCALKQLFRFPGMKVGIAEGNNSPDTWLDILMLTVSNANYFGGSFHIAPRAKLDDGRVDLVAIHDAKPLTRAKLFDAVGKGKHEGHRQVSFRTAVSFSIHFQGTIRYEADGEVYASPSPLVITSVRGALNVCAPLESAR